MRYDKLVLELQGFCLNQQAFPEVPGGDADRIEVLDFAKDFFDL